MPMQCAGCSAWHMLVHDALDPSHPACILTHLPQLASLTRLRQLTLQFPQCGRNGYAPLRHLTALTRLMLEVEVHALPSCLSRLKLLRDLRIYSWNEGMPAHEAAALAPSLPSLQQLTRLDVYIDHEVPAAALTALTNLHTMRWESHTVSAGAALPPGAWVRGLRTLLLTAQLATASLPALSAAEQLERLGTVDHTSSEQPHLPGIIAFAGERPRLRLLVLLHAELQGRASDAAQQVQRRRADLQIVVGSETGMDLLFDGDA